MGERAVAYSVYRALLRAGREFEKCYEHASLRDILTWVAKANCAHIVSTDLQQGPEHSVPVEIRLNETIVAGIRLCDGSSRFLRSSWINRTPLRWGRNFGQGPPSLDHAFEALQILHRQITLTKTLESYVTPKLRPEELKFDVGEVVQTEEGCKGVVFGWDQEFDEARMASLFEEWQDQTLPEILDTPYVHLCCENGSLQYQPQSELKRITATKPLDVYYPARAAVDFYFDGFDGKAGAYIPNQHLVRKYPRLVDAGTAGPGGGGDEWHDSGCGGGRGGKAAR